MARVRKHLFIDAPLTAAAVGAAALMHSNLPLLAGVGAAVVIHAWATVHPRSSLYLPVCWKLPDDADGCALTFDDGPHPEHTPAVLDALARNSQRATFFIIGENARRHPALLRRIVGEGHGLGLHSHSHSRWFNCWPPSKVRRDLSACADEIAQATGRPAPRLFRPPVGLKNPLVADAVRDLDLVAVTWSGRAWDTGRATAEQILRALARSARRGSIVLMHDGHEPDRPADRAATVLALDRFLPKLALRSRALSARGRSIHLEET